MDLYSLLLHTCPTLPFKHCTAISTAISTQVVAAPAHSKTIKSFNLQKYLPQGGHEDYRKRLEHVLQLLADGVITVPTDGEPSLHIMQRLQHMNHQVHAAHPAWHVVASSHGKSRLHECLNILFYTPAGKVFKLDQVGPLITSYVTSSTAASSAAPST
jgi:hypothetical protein